MISPRTISYIVGALWGSSNQLQTGPTNAISLLVLSTILIARPANALEVLVMVGVFQTGMGLARLVFLVNFVSHSVIVGFTAGAGILIAVKQLPSLFGLSYPSHGLGETLAGFADHVGKLNWLTLALGLGTAILILVLLAALMLAWLYLLPVGAATLDLLIRNVRLLIHPRARVAFSLFKASNH